VVSGRLVAAAENRELAKALGVVLEADQAYVLDATELAAKCPSKYDGARSVTDRGGTFE
jgi:hypothetical protein